MPHAAGIDYEVMEQALRSLDRVPLPAGLKGLPPERDGASWTPAGIKAARLNARNDLPTPFALLRRSALVHNAEVMSRYCADGGALLAPHGKTTMAPALWRLQFEHGTWALTVALPHQAVTAHRFGIRRILLANEAADPRSLESLVRLAGEPGTEVYCFVDSVSGVRAYRAAIDSTGVEADGLRFLLDIGVADGRTGCRSRAEAEAVAREIELSGTGVVGGIGAYEGPAGEGRSPESLRSVGAYVDSVTGIFHEFHTNGVFAGDTPPVLSIGGSGVFDVVRRQLQRDLASLDSYRLVLRSGCYLIHDHGHYAALGPSTRPGWAYTPFQGSLELGATVISRPQADLALLNIGQRDVGSDKGPATVIDPLPTGVRLPIVKLNDQHAFVRPDDPTVLHVGTQVRVGISHPCTTLDKWRVLFVIDDDYNVIDAATTIF